MIVLLTFVISFNSSAQGVQRPKLVVGIVVDQMRWDYLYRYYDRYAANGGFKRMLGQGFTCENTFIPYSPTVTACGHASIYTGSVPAINGIAGNFWYDNLLNKSVYCTEDASVTTVGSNTTAGLQSPRNMVTNTICDELKLATNFKSKVVGIAIKDRGSILPAGHTADAAYWYDSKTGDWITSTFYMNALPAWVTAFNSKKRVDDFYKGGWNTLYPINTYTQSTADINMYEGKPFGADMIGFPYNLTKFVGTNYGAISSTPFGNTLTADMAKEAVINEQLGADAITDFLAVSFSSPDYVGHAYGPNSIEVEDVYLRLDKELGKFFDFLDTKVGKGQYTVFMSADHGVAHVSTFAKDNKIPSGKINFAAIIDTLNTNLKKKYGQDKLVLEVANARLHLNLPVIASASLNTKEIKNTIVDYLVKQPGIARAFDVDEIQTVPLNAKVRTMLNNGYYPTRSGQIQVILQPQWLEGLATVGTSHGLWNPYDAHIPLVWYGWGIKQGKTNRETYMTDIASTLAALLHIQMPNGSVGDVIEEVIK